MAAGSVQEIVDGFVAQVTEHLDENKLDGPVRLDPTRTMVLIPVKGRGQIHVPVNHQINEEGVQNVVRQIAMVPSLKSLLRES